jgi:hypothetical protein
MLLFTFDGNGLFEIKKTRENYSRFYAMYILKDSGKLKSVSRGLNRTTWRGGCSAIPKHLK